VSELDGLKLLRRIEEGVAGKFGEAFFKQIVRDLSSALNADAAFAGRLNDDQTGTMLAFWVRDAYQTCVTYPLKGTPCEFVYKGQITSFARDIGNIFPTDREWFAQIGVNSYLGIPIKGETGAVVGHLAVMDHRERDWHDADLDVLRLFSMRTAVELERANSHRQLEQSNQALAEVNERLMAEIDDAISGKELRRWEMRQPVLNLKVRVSNYRRNIETAMLSISIRRTCGKRCWPILWLESSVSFLKFLQPRSTRRTKFQLLNPFARFLSVHVWEHVSPNLP
jgi:hypothetical protein